MTIVELARADTDASAGGSNAGAGPDGSDSSENGLPITGLVIGGLLLLAGAVAVAWLRQRRHDTPTKPGTDGSEHGPGPESDSDSAVVANDGGTATASTDDTTSDSDASPAEDRPDVALLSNEERVVETLRRLGGRAKQQQVVQELGWTDARTSQVVSKLRDEGSIEGFRLGRENVLILSEESDEESNSQ